MPANWTFDQRTDRGWTDELFRGFNPNPALAVDPRNGGFDRFFDFRDAGLPTDAWTVTAVGSSTAVVDPTVNEIGALLLTTGASDNDGVQAQHLGCVVTLDASKVVAVEFRVKSVALTAQTFLFGLCNTDTTILSTSDTDPTTTDTIAFYSGGGDGVLTFGTNTTSTPVASSTSPGTLVADTYSRLGFRIEGNTLTGQSFLEVRYNGAIVANNVAAAALPNAALRLSFALKTQTTAAKVCAIDWIRMAVK